MAWKIQLLSGRSSCRVRLQSNDAAIWGTRGKLHQDCLQRQWTSKWLWHFSMCKSGGWRFLLGLVSGRFCTCSREVHLRCGWKFFRYPTHLWTCGVSCRFSAGGTWSECDCLCGNCHWPKLRCHLRFWIWRHSFILFLWLGRSFHWDGAQLRSKNMCNSFRLQ